MVDIVPYVFRFIHIVSGVMWMGGVFLWGMVIAPNVLARGPPMIRRPFMEAVMVKVSNYLSIAGALTILSGFVTMGFITGFAEIPAGFQVASWGTALGVGVVVALALFVIGVFMIRPTAFKMLALMKAMPAPTPGAPPAAPPPEIPALGKRLAMLSITTILLGMIALGTMAWAASATP